MVCVETEDDEDFGPLWKCECGYWNLEEDEECRNCWRFWE
jgi:hypothetical protein